MAPATQTWGAWETGAGSQTLNVLCDLGHVPVSVRLLGTLFSTILSGWAVGNVAH